MNGHLLFLALSLLASTEAFLPLNSRGHSTLFAAEPTVAKVTVSAPVASVAAPAPVANVTAPAPVADVTTPAPVAKVTASAPVASATHPNAIANVTVAAPVVDTTALTKDPNSPYPFLVGTAWDADIKITNRTLAIVDAGTPPWDLTSANLGQAIRLNKIVDLIDKEHKTYCDHARLGTKRICPSKDYNIYTNSSVYDALKPYTSTWKVWRKVLPCNNTLIPGHVVFKSPRREIRVICV